MRTAVRSAGIAFFLIASVASPQQVLHLEPGARIPLSLISTVSTRNASPGDRVYLESVFPVMVDRTLVVPPGTYVAGTVTQVKRPGRVKGRGELFIRFDWMRLPNGVMRDFSGTVGGLDGASKDKLDKKEGKITGDSSKGSDAAKIAQGAQAGAMAGALGGWAGGRPGLGMGTGVGAGAAAGLVAVLLTRGPDAVLAKGTTVEMILDRDLTFTPDELNFDSAPRATTANRGSGDPVRKLN